MSNLADRFATCRAIGHAWHEVPDDARWSPRRVFMHRMCLRCERCNTLRLDCIDAFGNVGARYYEYPDGYSYVRGTTPTRSDFRLMMLRPRRRRKPMAS